MQCCAVVAGKLNEMIKTENAITTIKCDKCGKESIAKESNYNDVFWREGWALNRGRKYEHLCYDCLPKKKQKAMDSLKQFVG